MAQKGMRQSKISEQGKYGVGMWLREIPQPRDVEAWGDNKLTCYHEFNSDVHVTWL